MLKIKRGKSGGAKNSAMFDFFQSKRFIIKGWALENWGNNLIEICHSG